MHIPFKIKILFPLSSLFLSVRMLGSSSGNSICKQELSCPVLSSNIGSSQSAFGSSSSSPASSMTSAPLFGTNLFATTTTNANSPKPQPRFGCGFNPPVAFDYSKTPLHCFLKFPSSQPPTFTFTNRGTPLFPQITSSPGRQTSKFKCSYCGHTSNPAPNVDDPFDHVIYKSVSALPPYPGKSHEELRWEDCQSKGKAPVNASATLFALPVLMLPVMPTNTALGSYPLLPYSGTWTTGAAFAPTPPLVQAPSTNFSSL